MNRTIKFRGLYGDEWVYGYLVVDDENRSGSSYILGHGVDGIRYRVKAETVGQLTGLKDKNGKELYYGDIVRIDVAPERLWMATKDDFDIPCFLDAGGAFGVMLTFEKVFLGGVHNCRDGFEIIGNTHENQELLSE